MDTIQSALPAESVVKVATGIPAALTDFVVALRMTSSELPEAVGGLMAFFARKVYWVFVEPVSLKVVVLEMLLVKFVPNQATYSEFGLKENGISVRGASS